jgi:hypothetical protein
MRGMKGLFKSLYGITEEGVYNDLYSRDGSSPPTKRMDIRLGQVENDEEDDEEDALTILPETAPETAPEATPSIEEPFFSQEFLGFPNWLIGIFVLGFAYAYRRRKKATS